MADPQVTGVSSGLTSGRSNVSRTPWHRRVLIAIGRPSRLACVTDAASDLETLVGEWLSIPELGDAIGLTQRQARRLVDDKVVLAHRVGPNNALCVPAAFVEDDHLLTGIEGTITVLLDARLSPDEALRWLFTVDPTLPIEGSPLTMLQAHRKAEVRKRASELAF